MNLSVGTCVEVDADQPAFVAARAMAKSGASSVLVVWVVDSTGTKRENPDPKSKRENSQRHIPSSGAASVALTSPAS